MAYRLLFVFGSLFYLISVFIYIAMAISIPVASKEQVKKLAATADGTRAQDLNPDGLDEIQAKLSKINEMREQKLITDEEADKLRAKALGID